MASGVLANLSVAYRATRSFSHHVVAKAERITDAELDAKSFPKAKYGALDASLWGFLPYERWLLLWELTWVRPITSSEDELVLEEIQRVMIGREGVITSKLGPMFALQPSGNWYAGALVEHLTLLGRSKQLVVRVGPSVWAKLTDHLEFALMVTAPVTSPDDLDWLTGLYGTAALIYRVATEDLRSHFP